MAAQHGYRSATEAFEVAIVLFEFFIIVIFQAIVGNHIHFRNHTFLFGKNLLLFFNYIIN